MVLLALLAPLDPVHRLGLETTLEGLLAALVLPCFDAATVVDLLSNLEGREPSSNNDLPVIVEFVGIRIGGKEAG